MPILYAPKPGTILLCHYKGEAVPEMNKLRPVIHLSSVSPRLALVVPLSTTPPKQARAWHYHLVLQEPVTDYFSETDCWVKCDMVSAISFDRLDLPRSGKAYGKRIYKITQIAEADLEALRTAVWHAIKG